MISDVGGVREVITPEQTGILVPENDVEGFAKQVIRLIEEPSFARSMGSAARRFASTEYSIQTAVARVTETYKEVLGR